MTSSMVHPALALPKMGLACALALLLLMTAASDVWADTCGSYLHNAAATPKTRNESIRNEHSRGDEPLRLPMTPCRGPRCSKGPFTPAAPPPAEPVRHAGRELAAAMKSVEAIAPRSGLLHVASADETPIEGFRFRLDRPPREMAARS